MGIPMFSSDSSVAPATLTGVSWAGVASVFLLAVLRLYTRAVKSSRLYWDDAWQIAALSFLLADGILLHFLIPPMYSITRVDDDLEVPRGDFSSIGSLYLKLQFAYTILFWCSLWCAKASFLAFFCRFGERARGQRLSWWLATGFVGLALVFTMITYPIACNSFVLSQCSTSQHIQSSLLSLQISSALDIGSTIAIMIFSLSLLYNVKLSIRYRTAIAAVVFSLGAIVIAFAIARLVFTSAGKGSLEPTQLALWSTLESSLAAAFSCTPALAALIPCSTIRPNQHASTEHLRLSEIRQIYGLAPASSKSAFMMDSMSQSPPRDGDLELFGAVLGDSIVLVSGEDILRLPPFTSAQSLTAPPPMTRIVNYA